MTVPVNGKEDLDTKDNGEEREDDAGRGYRAVNPAPRFEPYETHMTSTVQFETIDALIVRLPDKHLSASRSALIGRVQ